MKKRFLALFPFSFNDPHVTLTWGHICKCGSQVNDHQETGTGGHIHAYLGNQIRERKACIDKAFKHSKGVF